MGQARSTDGLPTRRDCPPSDQRRKSASHVSRSGSDPRYRSAYSAPSRTLIHFRLVRRLRLGDAAVALRL